MVATSRILDRFTWIINDASVFADNLHDQSQPHFSPSGSKLRSRTLSFNFSIAVCSINETILKSGITLLKLVSYLSTPLISPGAL
jgi:hypothetical protein